MLKGESAHIDAGPDRVLSEITKQCLPQSKEEEVSSFEPIELIEESSFTRASQLPRPSVQWAVIITEDEHPGDRRPLV